MKSSKIKITATLFAAACMFAGCGDAFYELTPEEENAVVSYASGVVSKYNTFQQDGEVFVMQETLDGETETKEEPKQEESSEEEPKQQEKTSDVQAKPDGTEGEKLLSPDQLENTADTVSLGEALKLEGIQADCTGNSLCTTYEKSDSYVVDAAAGSQILVLDISLKNQTGQDAHVDILKMKPSFRIIVNETETAAAQMTILPNDLSTYQGDIPAGAAEEMALLFQIPQDIQEISSLQLKVVIDDTAYMVNL